MRFHFSDSNPGGSKFSISLWMRVLSPQSSAQMVFGTGSTSWDTGAIFQVKDSAKIISGRLIVAGKNLYSEVNVHDTLATWSHILFNFSYSGIH